MKQKNKKPIPQVKKIKNSSLKRYLIPFSAGFVVVAILIKLQFLTGNTSASQPYTKEPIRFQAVASPIPTQSGEIIRKEDLIKTKKSVTAKPTRRPTRPTSR